MINDFTSEPQSPMLPSEWAQRGYFVVEPDFFSGKCWEPFVGAECDFYDRRGVKRFGVITDMERDCYGVVQVKLQDSHDGSKHKLTIRHGR